jgi:hypothetical protein
MTYSRTEIYPNKMYERYMKETENKEGFSG